MEASWKLPGLGPGRIKPLLAPLGHLKVVWSHAFHSGAIVLGFSPRRGTPSLWSSSGQGQWC